MGGVGNLLHDGVVDGAKTGSVRLAKMAGKKWMEWFGRLSRGLGVVAAGVVAVMDFRAANQERQRGNYGMLAFYIVSGVAGVGAALLLGGAFGATILGLSATGVGLVLVLVGIAIALLIEFFKTDELQDWMERCLFGALEEGKRYQELE